MRPAVLGGVLAPLATPFDIPSGDVAPGPLRQAARSLLSSGLSGVVVSGSTGEGELLDDAERVRVVECVREAVPEGKWLIAGAGAESTRAAVHASREAGAAGADAVMVRPPAYYGALVSAAAFADHYRRVADESPVPVVVYNIPKYTHVVLEGSVMRALDGHPNVIGYKDSSGDLKVLAAYLEAAPRLAALVGSGAHVYPALELGAVGGVLAMACFAAESCVAMFEAFKAGDRARAAAIQERLTPLAREIVGAMGPAGIKAAMDARGLPGGPVRAPLAEVDASKRARIAELLGTAGLLAAA